MRTARSQNDPREVDVAGGTGLSRKRQGGWALACVAAAVILGGAAQPRQQTPATSKDDPNAIPQASSTPVANEQLKAPDQTIAKPSSDAPVVAQNQQNAQDSAKLLKLATDLKAEVDKTNKDTLSLRVVRKADEIERLARSVRERTNQAVRAR